MVMAMMKTCIRNHKRHGFVTFIILVRDDDENDDDRDDNEDV